MIHLKIGFVTMLLTFAAIAVAYVWKPAWKQSDFGGRWAMILVVLFWLYGVYSLINWVMEMSV